MKKLDLESRIRFEEIGKERAVELASHSSSLASVNVPNSAGWFGQRFDMGVGLFDNSEDSLDSFISRFEVIARSYKLPEELWAVEFSKALHGISLEVYQMLENESRMDYDSLINALRKRFGITVGSYRKRFKTAKALKEKTNQIS